jgi:transcriptional regulator GlxA family with amidase domain
MQRRIEILTYPQSQLLDTAGPLQVFASANDLERQQGRPAPYQPVAVSPTGPTLTSCGLELAAGPLPHAHVAVDTVIAAGGWGVLQACEDPRTVQWLAQRAQVARRTASVCSGAFLLAQAGLLDGRRAVTHWQRCAEFQRRFPKVRVLTDPIFVQDGPVWTSAGVTAGIDLALALVEADHGRTLALAVARQLVMFLQRPGGQSQFSTLLELQSQPPERHQARFDVLHAWIAQHLRTPLRLTDLADQAGMSSRSFSRHYLAATGRTPRQAVEHIRLEATRRLLEQGARVSQACDRCGWGSEESMRRAFQRALGVSPQDYRDRFSRTETAPGPRSAHAHEEDKAFE